MFLQSFYSRNYRTLSESVGYHLHEIVNILTQQDVLLPYGKKARYKIALGTA